jgi:hypothetical protein
MRSTVFISPKTEMLLFYIAVATMTLGFLALIVMMALEDAHLWTGIAP